MPMEYKDKKEWLSKNKSRLRRNIGKAIERSKDGVDVEILKAMIEIIDIMDCKKGGRK